MCEEYNGWSNRETWALNLWLSNDQGLYEMTQERIREMPEYDGKETPAWQVGRTIRDFWEELTDPTEGLLSVEQILDMVRDIGSEYRVNWDEIGAEWLTELAES